MAQPVTASHPSRPAFKVAYNGAFGGFSLSRAAVRRGREISGNPKWADITLPGEEYDDGSGVCEEPRSSTFDSYHLGYRHPRHDPVLVQIIEEMGRSAGGELACLKIETVSAPYRIDEYDGNERVMTAAEYDWIDPSTGDQATPPEQS